MGEPLYKPPPTEKFAITIWTSRHYCALPNSLKLSQFLADSLFFATKTNTKWWVRFLSFHLSTFPKPGHRFFFEYFLAEILKPRRRPRWRLVAPVAISGRNSLEFVIAFPSTKSKCFLYTLLVQISSERWQGWSITWIFIWPQGKLNRFFHRVRASCNYVSVGLLSSPMIF